MPWDTNDYPDSWKNLNSLIRKKAIEIGNSMLDDGYKESDAIPIATQQAKKWYAEASQKEKDELQSASDKDVKNTDKDENSRPELMEKEVFVLPHEDGWAVQSEDAKQPSNIYNKKEDAVARAQEIAQNKETSVIVHKKDKSVEKKYNYSSKS